MNKKLKEIIIIFGLARLVYLATRTEGGNLHKTMGTSQRVYQEQRSRNFLEACKGGILERCRGNYDVPVNSALYVGKETSVRENVRRS